jgi:ABC-type multidrug transport system fused ATPase/permease subunit
MNLFLYSINLRGGEKILTCYTSEICYDSEALISILFPQFSYFLFILGGYFSFGLNFLGVLFSKIYIQDLNAIFHFFLGGDVNLLPNGKNVCSLIDCGVNWEPDISVWFNKFGFFLLISLVSLLGVFYRYLINTYDYTKQKFVQMGIAYFIFLQLISFPCGQFITTSSSNILSLFFFISYFIIRKIA